jgi:hypothetical protein
MTARRKAGQAAYADPGLPTYGGYPVLYDEPVYLASPRIHTATGAVTLGSEHGLTEIFPRRAFPLRSRMLEWVFQTRAELARVMGHFDAVRGCALPFWAPSYNEDFVLTENRSSADTYLRIKDIGYRNLIGSNTARQHVCIFQPDGAKILRKILSATGDGTTEILGLDAPLGADVIASGRLVSYLERVRFGSDEARLEWQSSQVATLQLPLVILPVQAP